MLANDLSVIYFHKVYDVNVSFTILIKNSQVLSTMFTAVAHPKYEVNHSKSTTLDLVITQSLQNNEIMISGGGSSIHFYKNTIDKHLKGVLSQHLTDIRL